MRDLTGIQVRTDRAGLERYRGYVKDRGKKVFGPWTASYPDAKAWRVRALAAKLDGPLRSEGQRLDDAAERFLTGIESGVILSRKDQSYAPRTVRGYRQAFEDWILPELGHIAVDRLRRSQVQRWVDWLSTQVSGGTTRNTWAALAAMYSWLLPRHDEIVNPTDGVRLPRPGKPRERYAEPAEMAVLLEVLPPDLALPYALAFYAGLRRAEMQALRWSDVEDEWIRVARSLDPVAGFVAPKSGKPREVPIFDALRPFLESRGEGLVLPSPRQSRFGTRALGTPYTKKCAEIWKARGLEPIGLHEGRHSFATALVNAGYPINKVQRWIGHSDPSTTLRIYVKAQEREAGAAELMNTFLGAP